MKVQEAIKSDGSVIRVGDEVEAKMITGNGKEMWYSKHCEGVIFVVEEITRYSQCSCGYMVLAHLKGSPDRKLMGVKFEGMQFPDGLSADWFMKINVT